MGKPMTRSHSLLKSTAAATTTTTTNISQISSTSAAASKIQFRSKKIQKLPTTKTPKTTTTTIATPSAIITIKPLLQKGEIDLALAHLRQSDPLLATLIDNYKPPTFDSPAPPFLSLTKTILYQQLATAAAKSIYTRFLALCGGESSILPEKILSLSPQQLREIGISGRKASYLHDLAEKFSNGSLSDEAIVEMDDEVMLTRLTGVKGIGVWSVHMFMMFNLRRPDVLPVGDLGVRKGVMSLYGLKELPKPVEMEVVCEKWKPYRSVGSWYMWRLMEAQASAKAAAKKV